VALLIPKDWDKVDNLDAYFLSKRRWFYSVYLLGLVIDVMDSYLKGGWTYVIGLGVLSWGILSLVFQWQSLDFAQGAFARIR
jgi:hypothetical protein